MAKSNKMSYLVIARKYRPKYFSEIVGQEHITRTLINAINDYRVAHAYLFSGPRGVGKTTTARILSKSLNCQKGPTALPCNTCSNCREIDDSINLDVLEIDGASNRGIEEIRTLQENTRYAPGRGNYKIYIIDEVHMLTKHAFNALLKTLEEPPKHVIFIFATTEPHKVPMTVLSRCQRFNFRRLTVSEIEGKLKEISEKEKIPVEDLAVKLIARQADGSLRDGESMLDQLFTYSDGKITVNDVQQMFGFVEEEIYFSLTDSIKGKDEKKILKIIDTVFDKGYDMEEFVSGYIKHLRKLFLLKNDVEISDLSSEELSKYIERENTFSSFLLLQILNRLSVLIRKMKNSAITRILLEIELLTLSRLEDTVQIKELIQRLEKMKEGAFISSIQEENTRYESNYETEMVSEIRDTSLETLWKELVEKVSKKRRPLAAILYNFHPISFENGLFTINIKEPNSFLQAQLDQNGGRKLIEEILASITGKKIKVEFVEENSGREEKKKTTKSKKEALKDNDMVKKVQEILKAKILKPNKA